ncbi:hypothetical protein ABZ914_03270 [Spirillospora sp. NPDC046719]
MVLTTITAIALPASAARSTDGALGDSAGGFMPDAPWVRDLLRAYGTYGVLLFVVLLVIGWWLARRSGDPAQLSAVVWTPIGTLAALGLVRPFLQVAGESRTGHGTHMLVLAHQAAAPSFPSDHATMAGALATGLLLIHRRLGSLACAAALVMVMAGVYVAAYPVYAVLIGVVLGSMCVLIGYFLFDDLLVRLLERLGESPLRSWVRARHNAAAHGDAGGPVGEQRS